jgi:hypothetical protein
MPWVSGLDAFEFVLVQCHKFFEIIDMNSSAYRE